uniref:Uncharacterized protein n=1 Tax=Anguilla anguilla TaxID=7936 RepID=A0A0E9PEK0_ANGAN
MYIRSICPISMLTITQIIDLVLFCVIFTSIL